MPNRHKPASGVRIDSGEPTIVFVTVCTKDRRRWLDCEEAHRQLLAVWQQADAWLVGHYVLMPDHLHLFAAPRDLRFTIEQWITFWKSQFTRSHAHPDWLWQPSAFHHRLRRQDSYSQKWIYVQENPVRAGLVSHPADWPFQGFLHPLIW